MDYDPVKDRLGDVFWTSPARTKVFYRLLDTVFLRSWYVRRTLRQRVEAAGPGPVRVLDAGTGFGQYAWWLVDTFPNVRSPPSTSRTSTSAAPRRSWPRRRTPVASPSSAPT